MDAERTKNAMIRQSKRIPTKRATERRHRPELFFKPEKPEPWKKISKRIRLYWWNQFFAYPKCGICGMPITKFKDLVPDHKVPGKMGGCKDHSESNLQPAHSWCNLEKGSRRDFTK